MSWVTAARARSARFIIVLLAACIAAAMVAIAWIDVEKTREREVASGVEHVQGLATAIGTDLDRNFASIDVALGVVAERLSEPGSDILHHLPALVWFLHSIQGRLPWVHGIGLVDSDGCVRVDTAPGPGARANVAHRRYHAIHRERPDAGLVIDGPIVTGDGVDLVVFAQRLSQRDGGFGGIVRAAVPAGWLRELFERAAGAADPAVSAMLLRDDGTIVMRTDHAQASNLAAVPAEHPLRRAIEGAAMGQLALADPVDGVARVAAFYRLRGRPFSVVVGIDQAAMDDRPQRTIVFDTAVVLFGMVAIFAVAWWLIRAFGVTARLAERLAASEERFRDFASASSDWLFESDVDHRFTFVSDNIRRAVRARDPGAMIGKRRTDIIDPSIDPALLQRHLEDVARHRPYRDFVYPVRGDGGRVHYNRVSAVPVRDAAGRFLGYRGVAADVTEIMATSEAKRTLELELQQRQKLESLGTLAGGIAHDFNNALVPILALAQTWAKRGGADTRMQQDMARIVTAARHSRDIVRKILAFSRREEGSLEPVELAACVAEAASLARLGVPPDVALEETYDGAPSVLADRSQIVQIVTNMVANAVHAIGGGGRIAIAVGVAGERDRAAHDLPAGEPMAVLRIADSGCGMDAATLARIFEPYFTTKPVGVGTGLGLAVVHGIVTRHGGQIRVDSTPGVGTTFSIYLPLAAAARQAA